MHLLQVKINEGGLSSVLSESGKGIYALPVDQMQGCDEQKISVREMDLRTY